MPSDIPSWKNKDTDDKNLEELSIILRQVIDEIDSVGSSEVFADRGDPAANDYAVADLTTDGAWHDLDLSSIVPAGAKAVLLYVQILDNAASSLIVFRKNGIANSANAGVVSMQVANITNRADIIVACDTNRVIEYLATNTTWTSIGICVRGWWF